MATTTGLSKGPIQLQYDGGQVVVTPGDQDRFVLASQHAVSACQRAVMNDRFTAMFSSEVLMPLHQWCLAHRESVERCYVPFEKYGNCIKVFIVGRGSRFDFALSDAISDLEATLLKSGWPCDVLQLTSGAPEELRSFFAPEQSIEVFRDGHSNTA